MENLTITSDIANSQIVKTTIAAIRIMWVCRTEKPLYNRWQWLTGLDKDYEHVLSLLFRTYGYGHENTNEYAKRLANIK